MSLWYKILYQIGVTPWEEDPTKGAAAEQISALFEREENELQLPFGEALTLDVAAGSGPFNWWYVDGRLRASILSRRLYVSHINGQRLPMWRCDSSRET